MKVVYLYDGTPCLVYKDEDGEYQYPNDEWTEVSPPEGIYSPFYFNGNEWIGSTREEWLENLPVDEENIPSDKDFLNAQLISNDIEHNAKIKELQQDIANLATELLTIKGGTDNVSDS